jgi:hypothetical protein
MPNTTVVAQHCTLSPLFSPTADQRADYVVYLLELCLGSKYASCVHDVHQKRQGPTANGAALQGRGKQPRYRRITRHGCMHMVQHPPGVHRAAHASIIGIWQPEPKSIPKHSSGRSLPPLMASPYFTTVLTRPKLVPGTLLRSHCDPTQWRSLMLAAAAQPPLSCLSP